jgi:hypothetical protein
MGRRWGRGSIEILGALVSDDAAFAVVHTATSTNPTSVRDLLSVVVADGDAGRMTAEAADSEAAELADDAATARAAGATPVPDLTSAGKLLGSVASAIALTESPAGPATKPGEALNYVTVRVAAAVERTDPTPTAVAEYLQNGRLIDPAIAEKTFGTDAMRASGGLPAPWRSRSRTRSKLPRRPLATRQ